MASLRIVESLSSDKKKKYFYLEWGRKAGMMKSLTDEGIFMWTKPNGDEQRQFNLSMKSALANAYNKKYMELNRSVPVSIEMKGKDDFICYYDLFVQNKSTEGRRHLKCSYDQFVKFIKKDKIKFEEITEELCTNFRDYLLNKYRGETPSEYMEMFKKVLKQATKDGYYNVNPAADVKSLKHDSELKDVLEVDEWQALIKIPCSNPEIKRAALFTLNSGLRFGDIKTLEWKNIKNGRLVYEQKKTRGKNSIVLNADALAALGEIKQSGLVFNLPTANGCNKMLKAWVKSAKIDKVITWHSLRHTVSTVMQDNGIPAQTVAGFLGHKSTKLVQSTYNRYSIKQAAHAVSTLPSANAKETLVAPVISNDAMTMKMAFIKELKALGMSNDEIKEELKKL